MRHAPTRPRSRHCSRWASGAIWAAIALPVWLAAYFHGYVLPGAFPAMAWHAHEMVFGFALAAVAGFLLTAISNWTGRSPLRGAALAALWLAGRVALLAALGMLLAADVLVHVQVALGQRLGIATLLALIALVGGRIVPSFTRNWLAKNRPLRWRTLATLREPLLFVLHAGYGWLAFGLAFLGLNGIFLWLPPGAPLHALTLGAIGTMTLAVMARATLGHTGRPLTSDAVTVSIYLLVTLAAVLRVSSAVFLEHTALLTAAAGLAWTAAFGAFVVHYAPLLLRPRAQ